MLELGLRIAVWASDIGEYALLHSSNEWLEPILECLVIRRAKSRVFETEVRQSRQSREAVRNRSGQAVVREPQTLDSVQIPELSRYLSSQVVAREAHTFEAI